MGTFTWTFDAPTGVFKSREMSSQLFETAIADTVFMPHVQSLNGLGKKKGETITGTRVRTIAEPTSALLTEGQRIPEDTYQLSTFSVTVKEMGRSVPFTSLAADLTFFDLENSIQKKLRQQMTLTLDTAAAAAFKTAKIKYVPRGVGAGSFDTAGVATLSALAPWGVYHCEVVRDYLYDTLYADGVDGGSDYVGIFRTKSIRGLKNDADWENWHYYTNPSAKFNSEVGKMECIRHIETNHSQALGNVGTGSVLGEGVVFGADAVCMAEVLTPELRGQVNVGDDFGRANAVAWYGILNFGLIWDTANAGEAKIIHVTSA